LQGGEFEEEELEAEGEECSSDDEEVYYCIPLYSLTKIFFISFPQPHGFSLLDSTPLLCLFSHSLHLTLITHCQIYIRPSETFPKMTTAMFAETENLQCLMQLIAKY
jgi:hypothetical protein